MSEPLRFELQKDAFMYPVDVNKATKINETSSDATSTSLTPVLLLEINNHSIVKASAASEVVAVCNVVVVFTILVKNDVYYLTYATRTRR